MFLFPSRNRPHTSSAESDNQNSPSVHYQETASACFFSPDRVHRETEYCLDILHDVLTLTHCNLRVTQLSLTPHALSAERVSGQGAICVICFVRH